ncbi:alpha/beta hydrolase [Streptomyces sp. NPDC051320]|uniref:alpha/beta fold hydrolase n=1 Tax=Streptomyces sp. NPDC051320 TaxID=3154644 RepID=UPI0034249766
MRVGKFNSLQAQSDFDVVYAAGMRMLPTPAVTHDVVTDFGSVRVYRFGPEEGAPIVLLPGRAGTAVMWQPNLTTLAEHHPVFVVEPLGEPGRSTQTASLSGGADQAAWLHAVLTGLDLDGVHLVGHSFGGWLACNYAVRSSDRLATLTLLDPVNTLGRFPVALLFRSALAALPLVSKWGRPSFVKWINGGVPPSDDDPVAAVIQAGMRDYQMAAPMPEYINDDQLRSITIPVLVLVAGRSVMHDPKAAHTRARSLIPDVQAELWATSTHSLPSESPVEVNTSLLGFVDRIAV